MADRKRVGIIHAFSRANAGDGLLVDLTLEALADAGVAREDCFLYALDPESFPDFGDVRRAPGEPTARPSRKLTAAGVEVLASMAGAGSVRRALATADALVAVGGGYLVADSPVRQGGVIANHLAQLRAAADHQGPAIYLPQSIGPLHGIAGHWTRVALGRMDRVWVRDDETMAELALPNLRRCADLAVMKLARTLPANTPETRGGEPILVARELPRCGDYHARLHRLGELLPSSSWAVQADIAGPRSDAAFYRRLGLPMSGPLAARLAATDAGGPVVSVRLHGAIASLIAGRPAIHLAYERKGWGAYEDLGLEAFVHDARTFDPAVVAAQAEALARDSSAFWSRVAAARDRLTRSWRDMTADLAARLAS